MGRTGTLHAWEQEGVVPDLQTMAKGLGGGYAPIAALLMNQHVVDTLTKGTGAFSHSQTYQGHPIACAAACRVQKIIQEDNLLSNVREMGEYLGQLLNEKFGENPHVGNIRGRGLFWAVSHFQSSMCERSLTMIPRLNLCKTRKQRSLTLRRRRLHGVSTRPLSSRNIPSH